MTSAYDAVTKENVTINGVNPATLEVEGNAITMTLSSELAENAEVIVTFANTLTTNGIALGKESRFRLTTNNDSGDKIGEISVVNEDGEVTASVLVVDSVIDDTLVVGDNINLILTSYDGDRLMDVDYVTWTIVDGENNISVNLSSVDSSYEVKAFLWKNMMPFSATK